MADDGKKLGTEELKELAKQADALAKKNAMSHAERVAQLEAERTLMEEQLEQARERSALDDEILAKKTKHYQVAQEQAKIEQKILIAGTENVRQIEALAKSYKNANLSYQEQLEAVEEYNKLFNTQLTQYSAIHADLEARTKAEKDINLVIIKRIKRLRDEAKQLDAIHDGVTDIVAGLMGVNPEASNSIAKTINFLGSVQLDEAGNEIRGMDLALQSAGNAFWQVVTPGNIMISILKKVAEATLYYAKQSDEARSQLRKSIQAGDQYVDMIQTTRDQLKGLTVDYADAGKAIQGLMTSSYGFTLASKDTQQAMTNYTAALQETGVSAGATGKVLDYFVFIAGESGDAAKASAEKISKMAIAIGMPVEEAFRKFSSLTPKLAHYGSKMADVFNTLQAQAKTLGMEVDEMYSVTEQFDTFEGAAQAVGQLNAAFNLNIDSMKLHQMTEKERIPYLMKHIQGNHQLMASYNAASDQEKKYMLQTMGQAAGIKDLSVLKRMMAGDVEKTTAELEKEAAAQKKVEDRARSAQSVMDTLKNLMQLFAISIQPLVDGFKNLINAMINNDGSMTTLGKTVLWITGLTYAFILALKISKSWIAITAAWKAIKTGATLAEITATSGATIAGWAYNFMALANIGAAIKWLAVTILQLIKWIAFAAAMVVVVAIVGTILILWGLWTAAMWLLNGAMMANPVVLIIMAIIAVLALVYIYWDEVSSFFMSAINAIGDAFVWLGEMISGIFTGIINIFKKMINFLIDGINMFQVKIPNWVPIVGGKTFGFDIPRLAEGGENLAGGTYMVGEQGPELVILPQGSTVVSNDELEAMSNAFNRFDVGAVATVAMAFKMVSEAFERMAPHLDTIAAGFKKLVPDVQELVALNVELTATAFAFERLARSFMSMTNSLWQYFILTTAFGIEPLRLIAGGIHRIGLALQTILEEYTNMFLSVIDKIKSLTELTIESLWAVGYATRFLISSINDLSISSAFAFVRSMHALEDMFESANENLSGDTTRAVVQVVDNAIKYADEAQGPGSYWTSHYPFQDLVDSLTSGVTGALTAGLQGITSSISGLFGGDSGEKGKTITLEVDGREIGRIIDEHLQERHDLRMIKR